MNIDIEDIRLGYIKMFRKLLKSSLMQRPNICHFWIYCLLRAQFQDTETAQKYQLVKLKPGQFVFGRKTASKDTGLSEQTIRTCIKHLVAESRIEIDEKSTKQFSVINIVNWDTYQNGITPTNQQLTNSQPPNNQRVTKGQPTSNQQLTTCKKVKNINKDKKEKNVENEKKREENMLLQEAATTSSSSLDKSKQVNKPKQKEKVFQEGSDVHLLTLFLRDSICKNKPDFRFPKDWQDWAKTFDLMIRIDKRNPQRIVEVIEWAQAHPFWQTNILSARSLRKQFDQLEMKMVPKTENPSGMPRELKDAPEGAQPNDGVLDLIIKRYKANFLCMDVSEESYSKFVRAAIRAEEFSVKTNIEVKEVVGYLIECLKHNYADLGKAVLPGHLCSDTTWHHLMPQSIDFLPQFNKS